MAAPVRRLLIMLLPGLLLACGALPGAVQAAEKDDALGLAQRLREHGPLSIEERKWVWNLRKERRLTDEQVAAHLERLWYSTRRLDRQPRASGKNASRGSRREPAALALALPGPLLASLLIGAFLTSAILLAFRLRTRQRWLQHRASLRNAQTVSDIIGSLPPPAPASDSPPADLPPESRSR